MARVRRGLIHAAAWALATAAAVTLSWFGVRSVLRSTAYDPPRALPITGVPGGQTSPPVASSTHRPRPTLSPTAISPSALVRHATTSAAPSKSPTAHATSEPPKPPPGTPLTTPSASDETGNVHSYTVNGGRVVLDLQPDSASLVSATPNPGWQMQVWTQTGWLRVTFTPASGAAASSVFCTWNGHPPTVQTYEG